MTTTETRPESIPVEPDSGSTPSIRDIARYPLPHQSGWLTRVAMRGISMLARRQVKVVHGFENVTVASDPFIIAVSHTIHREAVLVPTMLMLMRGGRLIHFLADWNFMLIPGIGWLMRKGGAITVARKSAGPLNFMQPLYRSTVSPAQQARQILADGRSVGVFPEGTTNRDLDKLLYGRAGTARLSIESGVPVVPVGIRFPESAPGRAPAESAQMEVFVGQAMVPPPMTGPKPTLSETQAWHAEIMQQIAVLSDKTWTPRRRSNGAGEDVSA